jgi:hypothetical protein
MLFRPGHGVALEDTPDTHAARQNGEAIVAIAHHIGFLAAEPLNLLEQCSCVGLVDLGRKE